MQSLISSEDHFALFAIMCGTSVFGMWAEGKKWAMNIAGMVFTILLMALLGYVKLVPVPTPSSSVPIYDFAFTYVVALAIPLLLFNANIRRIIQEAGPLLIAYLLGGVGVILGALLAYLLIEIPEEGGKLTGVFISTFIGGSVNFLATSEILGFSQSPRFITAMAVDNFIFSLFIAGLFALPTLSLIQRYFIIEPREESIEQKESLESQPISQVQGISLQSLTTCLAIAGAIAGLGVQIGQILTEVIQRLFQTKISMDLLVITLLITLVANTFPKVMQQLEHTAFTLGMFFLYFFLAAIGASSDPGQIFATGPEVFLFATIILVVHLSFLLLAAKIFGIGIKTLAIASSANVGGPGVSAPMAAAMGLPSRITPAILIGILGYVIGTFIGVSVGVWLG
ncbi:MAG: DUF819 family protein [Bacteroidota bacterium]